MTVTKPRAWWEDTGDDPLNVEPDIAPLAPEARTDDANARRFVECFGDRFRYSKGLGWLAWDGARWAPDELDEAVGAATRIGHLVVAEAAKLLDGGGNAAEKLLGWGATSLNVNRVDALLRLARAHPTIAARMGDLDRDPWLLNVRNGTVDLRTGRLGPHRQGDLITKVAPVEYHPEARSPTWEAFLETVLPDYQLRAFKRRLAGYSLVGTVREHVLPIFCGPGANGKSTYVDTLLGVVGDYGATANRDLLTTDERGFGEHPTQLARLRGARLVGSVEVEDGRRLSEALVKQLTGGDRLAARHMRQDYFELEPTWLIFYAVNHKPIVHGTDHAIWRRLLLIPFDVTIPEKDRDPDLKVKLLAEAPGILAWAVAGCLEYQQLGLAPPDVVRAATNGYRAEEDVLGQYLEERCAIGANFKVPSGQLYDDYHAWCQDGGLGSETSTKFGRLLTARGFERDRPRSGLYRDVRMWNGLTLRLPPAGGTE